VPDVIATASRVTAHAAASVEAGAPRTEIISHAYAGRRLPSKVLSKPPLRGFRTVCARRDGVRVGVCRSWRTVQVCAPQSVSQSPDPIRSPELQRCQWSAWIRSIMYALTVRFCDFVDRMCWSCVCLGVRGKENCLHVMR